MPVTVSVAKLHPHLHVLSVRFISLSAQCLISSRKHSRHLIGSDGESCVSVCLEDLTSGF